MPVHDWSKIDPRLFHHFHHAWISTLCHTLNGGLLPPDRYALVEEGEAGANRLAIHHASDHRLVAVIDIVSPSYKNTRGAIGKCVEYAAGLLRDGVHLLIIDLIPPGPLDPHGLHHLIWDKFGPNQFHLSGDRPLSLASYVGGAVHEALIDPVGFGQALPDMPLFLKPDLRVPIPLESTYQTAWDEVPLMWQEAVTMAA